MAERRHDVRTARPTRQSARAEQAHRLRRRRQPGLLPRRILPRRTTETLIQALRTALYKRGVPEALYEDNGSIYWSKEISQICQRLGTLLCHAPVRDGAASASFRFKIGV
jgi:hypothetical protein